MPGIYKQIVQIFIINIRKVYKFKTFAKFISV